DMANAHADLKAVAQETTASNEDDGIAVVLIRSFATQTPLLTM
ncbi:HAD hydrolase family protein, partial [Streptomyces sp. NPDC016469]